MGPGATFGRSPGKPARQRSPRPSADPFEQVNKDRGEGAVVLIDEIDKADPDMPNGLLVPLGAEEFTVTDTGTVVRQELSADGSRPPHLVVITTNEERELPQAFLRRCVVAVLPVPRGQALATIAKKHLERYVSGLTEQDTELIEAVAAELDTAREQARQQGMRPPGTAEFLDALRACWNLGITVDSPRWHELRDMVLLKPHQPPAFDEQQHLAG